MSKEVMQRTRWAGRGTFSVGGFGGPMSFQRQREQTRIWACSRRALNVSKGSGILNSCRTSGGSTLPTPDLAHSRPGPRGRLLVTRRVSLGGPVRSAWSFGGRIDALGPRVKIPCRSHGAEQP
jgi:hypothetical protein